MKAAPFAVLAPPLLCIASCSTVFGEQREISYGCDDLVVIGRVASHSYAHVNIENDILGHGLITAEAMVERTLRGEAPGRTLPLTYVAHTYLVGNRDFLMVLRPADDGGYALRSAVLMPVRPQLLMSEACS